MKLNKLFTTTATALLAGTAAIAEDIHLYADVQMAEIIDIGNTPNKHSQQQYIMVSDTTYKTVEACQVSMLFNQLNTPEPYPIMRRKLQLESKTQDGQRIRPPADGSGRHGEYYRQFTTIKAVHGVHCGQTWTKPDNNLFASLTPNGN